MEKIKAVVFDLDGTLVDSLADIASAVNSTLVAFGRRPHALSEYNAMVGWGLKRLLITATAQQPFSDAEFEVALQHLLTHYRAHPVDQTRAYDGIPALLRQVAPHVSMGVLSNKEDGMTRTIVTTLFPSIRFAGVAGARPDRPHKPDPSVLLEMLASWGVSPSECAFLGDSGVDMETARRAGAIACGATWGFRDPSELSAAGAAALFADPEAFGRWLELRLSKL